MVHILGKLSNVGGASRRASKSRIRVTGKGEKTKPVLASHHKTKRGKRPTMLVHEKWWVNKGKGGEAVQTSVRYWGKAGREGPCSIAGSVGKLARGRKRRPSPGDMKQNKELAVFESRIKEGLLWMGRKGKVQYASDKQENARLEWLQSLTGHNAKHGDCKGSGKERPGPSANRHIPMDNKRDQGIGNESRCPRISLTNKYLQPMEKLRCRPAARTEEPRAMLQPLLRG